MPKYDVIMIRNAAPSDFGGAERYPVILAQELTKLGYKSLVLSHHAKLRDFAESQNVSSRKTPFLIFQNFYGRNIVFFPFYMLWQFYLTIRYYLIFRRYSATNIHLHSRDDFIAGTIAGSWLGCNIIWSDHADLKHLFQNVKQPFKNPIGKWILRLSQRVKKITTISQHEYQNIIKQIPKDHHLLQKVIVVYNGVSDRHKELCPKATINKSSDYIFANMGRLVSDKGVVESIEAFKKAHLIYPKTKLWIIGDGNQKAELERLAKEYPSIKFFGHQDDPLKQLAQANCLLAPSYHEGLGLSIIEACMLEKAIIASNVGGIPEVIASGTNGLLVPPRNTKALTEAMINIIKSPKNTEELSKQARLTYEKKFDLSKLVAKGIIPLYNKTNVKTAN